MGNNGNTDSIYEDADADLDRLASRSRLEELIDEAADILLSEEQLESKGKLLGHYKSGGLLRSYIDVYEKAIIGKAEMYGLKKLQSIKVGYRYLEWAVVENNILYLRTKNQQTYCLRHLKQVEKIVVLINRQKANQKELYLYEKRK